MLLGHHHVADVPHGQLAGRKAVAGSAAFFLLDINVHALVHMLVLFTAAL
jgi:hypothetical protein